MSNQETININGYYPAAHLGIISAILINTIILACFLLNHFSVIGAIVMIAAEVFLFKNKINYGNNDYLAPRLHQIIFVDILVILSCYANEIYSTESTLEYAGIDNILSPIAIFAIAGGFFFKLVFKPGIVVSFIIFTVMGFLVIMSSPGFYLEESDAVFNYAVYFPQLYVMLNLCWHFIGLMVDKCVDYMYGPQSAASYRREFAILSWILFAILVAIVLFRGYYVINYIDYFDLMTSWAEHVFSPAFICVSIVVIADIAITKYYEQGVVLINSRLTNSPDVFFMVYLVFFLFFLRNMVNWYVPFEESFVMASMLIMLAMWSNMFPSSVSNKAGTIEKWAVRKLACYMIIVAGAWFMISRGMFAMTGYFIVTALLILNYLYLKEVSVQVRGTVTAIWIESLVTFYSYYQYRSVNNYITIAVITIFAILSIVFFYWERPDNRRKSSIYMYAILIILAVILLIPRSYKGTKADYSIIKEENKVQTVLTASGDGNKIIYSVMNKKMLPLDDYTIKSKELVTEPVATITKKPKIECHYIEFISVDQNNVISVFRRFMPYCLLDYEHNWFISFFY